MDIKVNDSELGKLEISKNSKGQISKLNQTIKRQMDSMKPSLLTKKRPVKVLPKKDKNHKHVVETF